MTKPRQFFKLANWLCFVISGPWATAASFHLSEIPHGQAPLGFVEIQGVGSGPFNPVSWQSHRLHWVRDVRMPLLAPRMGGAFRNIYAPSAVEDGAGWLFFYSAWDGIESGNDRVYMSRTPDFIDFYDRHTVIHNGEFVHVSNVNVQRLDADKLEMFATAWPDPDRQNKPIHFSSSDDGKSWNGTAPPYRAALTDIVRMEGYSDYKLGDLNGANVVLKDGLKYRLYFTNWKDKWKTYWAEGDDPGSYVFGGIALDTGHAVNDVKKFQVDGKDWYLMMLHKKGDVGLTVKDANKLWFSLSNDGKTFGQEQQILETPNILGPGEQMDRYIFAVGLVTRKDRVLGLLYGAGPTVECNRNQIFGYWLQKKLILTAKPGYTEGNGAEYEAQGALGPDRQWIKLPLERPFEGTLSIYDENGTTILGTEPVSLKPGSVYQLRMGTD